MPRNLFRRVLLALPCMAAGLVPSLLHAQTAYAVTSANQLVSFNVSTPGTLGAPIAITGLQGGEQVLAIDARPSSGHVFALGSTSRIYIVSTTTGATAQVGPSAQFVLGGTAFGFDFNPTVDRIRVVSDADQNLRLNPFTGLAVTDITLAYAAGDVNAGQNPNVQGSAYTNNFPGALTTVLYGIDVGRDALVTQNPPNAGTLNTVGSLGVDATAVLGFDILSVGGGNVAYALLQVGGVSGMYLINLATGAAALIGNLPGGTTVTGLAVVADPAEVVNISTRARVLTGADVMIAGFVIQGTLPQTVVVRARGPSLAAQGVPGVLADPQLQLFTGPTQIGYTNHWQDTDAAAIQASGFAPGDPAEAAIRVTLQPGAYTAIVTGVGGGTGVAIVEVFTAN